MSTKPINIQAQRVQKVIQEQVEKLKVLSYLNTDFFETLKKCDEAEVLQKFGPKIGKMLINQAMLEEKFQTVCVEDGVKMTPLDDEFITEEAR